jgi:LPPG:FO 2-phospho-L-lactate transferase
VVVLTGGVGGAKLALGLARVLPPGQLTAVVNTGDDFTHLGLRICPDIDTLLYTLSGRAHAEQGWGRQDESWSFLAAIESLGGDSWFRLGDGDLALHVLRTAGLAAGESLSQIVATFADRWSIATRVLPMSEDTVATLLDTAQGRLVFQDYFVKRRCEPVVTGIEFEGAAEARPAPGVLEAIASASAVVIAPSNPFLSIAPILAVSGMREALAATEAPVVAVSPLVGGQAVKGPTAKLMRELGQPVSVKGIATLYDGVIDGLLVDERDPREGLPIPTARVDTLMRTLDDRLRVATATLALARVLG